MTCETPQDRRLRFQAAAAIERKVKRYRVWLQFMQARGIRYRDCRLHNFDVGADEFTEGRQTAVRQLLEFCTSIAERVGRGQNLLIYGPKGTGKDHLLAACSRAAIAAFQNVVWVNGAELLQRFAEAATTKGECLADIMAELSAPDVLYISDPLPPVGALNQSQATTLFKLLDWRYRQRKAVWASVNVKGAAELEERMTGQNADRLRDGAMAIKCNWPSYRKAGT